MDFLTIVLFTVVFLCQQLPSNSIALTDQSNTDTKDNHSNEPITNEKHRVTRDVSELTLDILEEAGDFADANNFNNPMDGNVYDTLLELKFLQQRLQDDNKLLAHTERKLLDIIFSPNIRLDNMLSSMNNLNSRKVKSQHSIDKKRGGMLSVDLPLHAAAHDPQDQQRQAMSGMYRTWTKLQDLGK